MKKWIVGGLTALALAGGGLFWWQSGRTPASGLPAEVFDRMDFPKGTGDMVGDSQGRMCHEVRLRNSAGETVIGREYLEGVDFRNLTGPQKKPIIIKSAKGIVERAGLLACAPDPALRFPDLASDAAAQPHCLDCGPGCGGVSCPAHVVANGCEMQGPDCIISILCCGTACNCW